MIFFTILALLAAVSADVSHLGGYPSNQYLPPALPDRGQYNIPTPIYSRPTTVYTSPPEIQTQPAISYPAPSPTYGAPVQSFGVTGSVAQFTETASNSFSSGPSNQYLAPIPTPSQEVYTPAVQPTYLPPLQQTYSQPIQQQYVPAVQPTYAAPVPQTQSVNIEVQPIGPSVVPQSSYAPSLPTPAVRPFGGFSGPRPVTLIREPSPAPFDGYHYRNPNQF